MAKSKKDLVAEARSLGVADVSESDSAKVIQDAIRAAKAAGRTRSEVVDEANAIAAQASGDEAGAKVRKGGGLLKPVVVRVLDGHTIVHGDPEIGEERVAHEGGDEFVCEAATAVEFVMAGQALMVDGGGLK